MIVDRTAMLFCSPLPPLRLAAGRPVVIGRHSSCDFSIRADDASRRHAEVVFEDDRYVVRDLGSTNGTFVNGERVDGSPPLAPGDRIEIGSSTITYCQVDVGYDGERPDDDPEEAKTIVSFTTPGREAFRGELAEIPADALLQVLELGGKTGVLEVALADGPARLWLAQGRPIHAEAGKQAGFDAALQIVGASQGRFRFDPQEIDTEPTISATVTELLLESCRLEDERSA